MPLRTKKQKKTKKETKKSKKTKIGQTLNVMATKMIMLTQYWAQSLLDFILKDFISDVNNPFTITLKCIYAPKKKKEMKKKTKTGQSLNVMATKMIMLTQCWTKSLLDFILKDFILDVNNPFTITLECLYAPKKKEKKKEKEN